MLLFAGDVVGKLGERLVGSANLVVLVLGALILFGIGGFVWALVRAGRSRS